MHWGNFARFASFFKMGTITSSTRAQKCSRELGWMSPQVMWFRSFCPASGRGSASRLTKNTPLFLYFIVVCICRYKITIIWSIFGVQLRKSRGYIWWLYTFSNGHTTYLGWPPFFSLGIISIKLILQKCSFFVELFGHLLFAIKKIPNSFNQIFKKNEKFLIEEIGNTNTLVKTRTESAL